MPEGAEGKRARCSACGAMVAIPSPDEPGLSPEPAAPPQEEPLSAAETPVVAAPAPGAEAIQEDLADVYRRFARSLGALYGAVGCLGLLAVGAGIAVGFKVGWLVGVVGAVAVLLALGAGLALTAKPIQRRARRGVEAVEAEHGLTHEQAADLVCSHREIVGGSEFKEFAEAVWEGPTVKEMRAVAKGDQYASTEPGETTGRAGAISVSTRHALACDRCGHPVTAEEAGMTVECSSCHARLSVPVNPPCPKCQSLHTVYELGQKGRWKGTIVGGALFGAVGAGVGSALTSKPTAYQCNDCKHRWGLRLPPFEG